MMSQFTPAIDTFPFQAEPEPNSDLQYSGKWKKLKENFYQMLDYFSYELIFGSIIQSVPKLEVGLPPSFGTLRKKRDEHGPSLLFDPINLIYNFNRNATPKRP
jgi:hypothetical protein